MADPFAAASAAEVGAAPGQMTGRRTRAERLAFPLARDVVKQVALDHGACIRPVQLRKTDLDTGEVELVMVPCGATLASICPPCAERNKILRAAQCRDGWHLEDEPIMTPGPPDDYQKCLVQKLADLYAGRDQAETNGDDTADFDDLIEAVQDELASTGVRGRADPSTKHQGTDGVGGRRRRHRSTRRRQDAPGLPQRRIGLSTVGRVYPGPNGILYRPSMFITLTCPSYGPVRDDGTPVDPDSYDYESAARDALHIAALFDRFIQNLRRFAGFEVQYFAVIEPQKRLAPHVHIAIRGTISRADLRKVLAATYHQVWWPSTGAVKFDGEQLPVWHAASRYYLDPETGEFLPTWDEALDAIGPADDPWHVARFGTRFDAQGVLARSKDAGKCIGYLTKYLVKQIGECHQPETGAKREHVARLSCRIAARAHRQVRHRAGRPAVPHLPGRHLPAVHAVAGAAGGPAAGVHQGAAGLAAGAQALRLEARGNLLAAQLRRARPESGRVGRAQRGDPLPGVRALPRR